MSPGRSPLSGLDHGRWKRINVILDEALDLDADALAACLDRACGDDVELRREIEGLLAADRTAGAFLERPAAELAPHLSEDLEAAAPFEAEHGPEPSGRLIGPWRIAREVGRGGMGAVYLAERCDGQFEQKVALKLVKRGLDTDEILARFRRERRILARLEHKHVARLVDGGVTDDGLPWLAMEFVDGQPIVAWCEERRAGIAERLRLFRSVCEAVQHAHRNLVVHRDLKPSNIFVTDDGEVKLLDFGIAQLLSDQDGAAESTLTGPGGNVLTPQYAAPEQLRGEAATTATDLYSLGVVLYELLAGARPCGGGARSLEELRRAILEEEPRPPSELRREWRQTLRGDLDRIVLMALRKEPEHRYPSVEALLSDLDRFRDGLPVRATPSSTSYRLAKFVGRHRAAAVASLIVALALVAGVVVALWEVVAVVVLLASLVGGLAVAIWQTRAARREARKADEVRRFLMSVFEVSDPSQARGQSVTARELLERGARRIETELRGQPALRAEILGVLVDLYIKLGLVEPGLRLGEREIELLDSLPATRPRDRAGALRRRGNLLFLKGDARAAEGPLREAAALHRAGLGEWSPEVAEDLDQIAAVLRLQAKLDEAERTVRQSLEIRRRAFGPRHPEVAVSLNNVAVMAREAGRLDEAEALYRECLEIRREVLPPDHPDIGGALSNLAVLLRQRGRYENALAIAQEAHAAHVKIYGEDHALTVAALNTVGALMLNVARPDEAERIFRRIMRYWEEHEGPQHPNAVATLNNVAAALRDQGRFAAAEPVQRDAVGRWRALFGDRHPFYALGLVNLAVILRELGRFDEGQQLLEQALEVRRSLHGEDHPEVATVLHHLADLAGRRERWDAAEPLYRQALLLRERHLGAANPATAMSRAGLASAMRRRGATSEAEPMLREALEVLRGALRSRHPDLLTVERELEQARAATVGPSVG